MMVMNIIIIIIIIIIIVLFDTTLLQAVGCLTGGFISDFR